MIFCFTGTLLKPEPNYKFGRIFSSLLYSFQILYRPDMIVIYVILYLSEYQATNDGWIVYEDKQYYFSKERVHMKEARRICQKNFADLVVIENESKRQFLWKYVSTEPINYN